MITIAKCYVGNKWPKFSKKKNLRILYNMAIPEVIYLHSVKPIISVDISLIFWDS